MECINKNIFIDFDKLTCAIPDYDNKGKLMRISLIIDGQGMYIQEDNTRDLPAVYAEIAEELAKREVAKKSEEMMEHTND